MAILNDPDQLKSSKPSGQNTNAGWFNHYIQTGKSDHETKSNGSIGGISSSMCITVHQYDSHMLSTVEVRVCVCVRLHKWCTFGTHIQRSDYMHTHQSLRGHGVGMVGSSWTGNIHPTPAIELLQGKRGDHGCMAKVGFVTLASSIIFSCPYAHCSMCAYLAESFFVLYCMPIIGPIHVTR